MVNIPEKVNQILREMAEEERPLGFAVEVALQLLEETLIQTFQAAGWTRDDAFHFAYQLRDHILLVVETLLERTNTYSKAYDTTVHAR